MRYIIVVLAMCILTGCSSVRSISASDSLSVATAQRFHAAIGDMLHGGDLSILCWSTGFPELSHTGARSVDSSGHAALPPLQWVFLEDRPPPPPDEAVPAYRHLLTIQLVQKRTRKSQSYLFTWRDFHIESTDKMRDPEDVKRLDRLAQKLIQDLKAHLGTEANKTN